MIVPVTVGDNVGEELGQALGLVAEQLRSTLPGVTLTSHHGENDHFPWWFVARLSNGAKAVDVTVECQQRGAIVEVRADISRENGFVLQEAPPVIVPVEELNNARLAEELKPAQAFLLGHLESFRRELTE